MPSCFWLVVDEVSLVGFVELGGCVMSCGGVECVRVNCGECGGVECVMESCGGCGGVECVMVSREELGGLKQLLDESHTPQRRYLGNTRDGV